VCVAILLAAGLAWWFFPWDWIPGAEPSVLDFVPSNAKIIGYGNGDFVHDNGVRQRIFTKNIEANGHLNAEQKRLLQDAKHMAFGYDPDLDEAAVIIRWKENKNVESVRRALNGKPHKELGDRQIFVDIKNNYYFYLPHPQILVLVPTRCDVVKMCGQHGQRKFRKLIETFDLAGKNAWVYVMIEGKLKEDMTRSQADPVAKAINEAKVWLFTFETDAKTYACHFSWQLACPDEWKARQAENSLSESWSKLVKPGYENTVKNPTSEKWQRLVAKDILTTFKAHRSGALLTLSVAFREEAIKAWEATDPDIFSSFPFQF